MSKEELGTTTFDSEELLRLRVGQYYGTPANEIILLAQEEETVRFIRVVDFIAQRLQELEKTGEVLPLALAPLSPMSPSTGASTPVSSPLSPAPSVLSAAVPPEGLTATPPIVLIWNAVREVIPTLALRVFVIMWYWQALERLAAAATSIAEEEKAPEAEQEALTLTPALEQQLREEVRALYQAVEDNAGPFSTFRIIDLQYQQYIDNREQQLAEDAQRLAYEGAVVAELAQLEPVDISTPEYRGVLTVAHVATPLDGLDIFDGARLDRELPLAVYEGADERGATRNFYALYRGTALDGIAPFQEDWLNTGGWKESVRFQLFTGGEDVERNYTRARYIWATAPPRLEIDVPFQHGFTPERALALLQERLPPFEVTERRDTAITGALRVRHFQFREDLFADMVMNDELVSRYLYIRETSLATETNRRPVYYLRAETSERLFFRIENRLARINEPFHPAAGGTILMEERTPYAYLTFEASSDIIATRFQGLVALLLARYAQIEDALFQEYAYFIPEFGSFYEDQALLSPAIETTIKSLGNIAPEVFSNNYARTCQTAKRQPFIMSEEQAAEWEKETFMYLGKQIHRRTMRFPIYGEDVTRIYGCADPDNPFPGLSRNNRANKQRFPFVPCCFGTDTATARGNPFRIYFHGEKEEKRVASELPRHAAVIVSGKFAGSGQIGELPRDIQFALQRYRGENDNGAGAWYRRGTVTSPSSVLHSLAAKFDSGYRALLTDSERERYIRERVRPALAAATEPLLLRQELPDLSNERITELLADPAAFLDPRTTFRALEEFYDINLVVFSDEEEEGRGTLEQPAAIGVSYRPALDPARDTVMVYKHRGGEGNAFDYPQSELLILRGEGEDLFLAGPVLTEFLSEAITARNRAAQWRFAPATGALLYDPQANLVLDLEQLFDVAQVDGQYIDAYGKLRFFVYQGVTIAPPLNRPLNAPGVRDLDDFPLVPLDRVVSFVEELREQGIDAWLYAVNTGGGEMRDGGMGSGTVTGVWWYLGQPAFKLLFFTPTVPSPLITPYDQLYIDYLPYPAVFTGGADVGPGAGHVRSHYEYLERVKYLLLQYLEYLFIAYSGGRDIADDDYDHSLVDDFLADYTEVRDGHVYQLQETSRYLPADPASLRVPTFTTDDGRLILNSPVLQARLRSYLVIFEKRIAGLDLAPPRVMQDYYRSSADFTAMAGRIVFDRFDRVTAWIQNFHQAELLQQVTRLASTDYQRAIHPYVLEVDGRLFLVQNVLDGNLQRALFVAQWWQDAGVNIGFTAPASGGGDYSLYRVRFGGELEPPFGNSPTFLLEYPDGRYAAMLYLS